MLKLQNLRGNPLRVIRFLYSSIEDIGNGITKKIQLSEIIKTLNITRDSARTAIKFLNKNNLIRRFDYFPGLGGWTRYELSSLIYRELLNKEGENEFLTFKANLIISLSEEDRKRVLGFFCSSKA